MLAATVLLYERELGRIARFAKHCDRTENKRIDVGFPTPGISSVATAVNSVLNNLRDERAAMARREEAFRRDLASLSHDIRTPLAGAQEYIQLYVHSSSPEEKARYLKKQHHAHPPCANSPTCSATTRGWSMKIALSRSRMSKCCPLLRRF